MATEGVVMETHEPNATLHAYLADFTINDAQLKSTHVDFLAKVIAAISANPAAAGSDGWNVTLWGKTSRTGSAELNRMLAGRRTAAVRSHLEDKLRSLANGRVRFVEFAWEEEMAGPDDDNESEFHRSVEVWLTKVPVPKPKKKLLIALPYSDRFKLRLLQEVEVSKLVPVVAMTKALSRLKWRKVFKFLKKLPKPGINFELMFFEIRDLQYKQSAYYFYEGVGPGVGFSLGTARGEWKYFRTSKGIHVSQFVGLARITTLGAGNLSKNYIYIHMPSGVDAVYMEIGTGTTRGAAGSFTGGDLSLIYVEPARGP
jgi:hypothetical protein